jgi:hypothetical protein
MEKLGPVPNSSVDLPDPKPEPRARQLADAIETLLTGYTDAEREMAIHILSQRIRPQEYPKAGGVLGVLLTALRERKDWTVEEFKETVALHGIRATDKQVFNAVGHLTRQGILTRVGYGRYVYQGTEIVTTDELGGEPSKEERMDPN